MRRFAAALLAAAAVGAPAFAQERPTVDVYLRSQAGLPPSSARGEIEVVDIGPRALDVKLSIVGHRTAEGWRVSYVCAQSPACDPSHFLLARDFALSADAARRLDAVLDRLRAEPGADGEAGGGTSAPAAACGRLAVAIDDRGFKRAWRRTCAGGDLAELEGLLKAGLP
jgi:hypothetical protein